MSNATVGDNLGELANQGQGADGVGQNDGSQQGEDSSGNWEEQAKYFQSEKDKLSTENDKLRRYADLGEFLESRPDITDAISNMIEGGQPTKEQPVKLSKDEFDPWEAYNDPDSKSFKYREQQLNSRINNAVDSSLQGVKQKMGRNTLETELRSKGLNDEQMKSFFDFASKNPSSYGVDGAIKMWQAVTGQSRPEHNPLDAIRNNQSQPMSGGALQGQAPERSDDTDDMWKGIMSNAKKSSGMLP